LRAKISNPLHKRKKPKGLDVMLEYNKLIRQGYGKNEALVLARKKKNPKHIATRPSSTRGKGGLFVHRPKVLTGKQTLTSRRSGNLYKFNPDKFLRSIVLNLIKMYEAGHKKIEIEVTSSDYKQLLSYKKVFGSL